MELDGETAKEGGRGTASVLLFGAETWVLLTAMSWNLEEVHVGLPRQITGQKAKRQRDENCQIEASEKVLKEAGNQSLGAYIDKWQATVAEWVALKPILDIFDKKTGYEGGGRRRSRGGGKRWTGSS